MTSLRSSIGISLRYQGEIIGMPNLKKLREDAGWTAAELAIAAGVSLSTVNRMESGKQRYAVSRLIANKVLRALSERLDTRLKPEDVDQLYLK